MFIVSFQTFIKTYKQFVKFKNTIKSLVSFYNINSIVLTFNPVVARRTVSTKVSNKRLMMMMINE